MPSSEPRLGRNNLPTDNLSTDGYHSAQNHNPTFGTNVVQIIIIPNSSSASSKGSQSGSNTRAPNISTSASTSAWTRFTHIAAALVRGIGLLPSCITILRPSLSNSRVTFS